MGRSTSAPAVTAPLGGLRKPHPYRNRLGTLPEWIGELTGVTFTDLEGNELTALPAALGRLTVLEFLDTDAHRFYERLGFKATHEGMKLFLG